MMMGTRHWFVVVLVLSACQSAAPPVDGERSARSSPPKRSCKPEAPVAVTVTTRSLAALSGTSPGTTTGVDELEVIATATATANVTGLEVALVLPPHATALGTRRTRSGALVSGDVVTLTTRVRVDRRSSEISAVARVRVADVDMARAATVAIGAPVAADVTRTYALPDGELVREVRP